jgi:hypothetical protein
MKMVNELVACILLAGAAIIAVAAEPQIKVAVVEVAKIAPSKPVAKPAAVKASEAAVHDYRLERESCCGPQN